jgi:hypothetical protein
LGFSRVFGAKKMQNNEFRRQTGVDVMITIFGQFPAKKCRFSSKPML